MTDIEQARYELGKDAKRKGEPLHDGASEEWRKGYSRSFGSNVTPKDFGKNDNLDEWDCYCGHHNTSRRRHIKGGVELCWNCNIERSYSYVRDE